jgi:6-phosphogluconolactonase (cycloisomerase 2 family)
MTRYLILVGSYTEEISTLLFDDDKGSLDLASTVKVGYHPSWITFHPSDRSIVFTGLEQSDGIAVALRFDERGKGEVIGKTASGGKEPCSVLATKDELLIANVSDIVEELQATFFCTLLAGTTIELYHLILQSTVIVLIRHLGLCPP